jgi:hypothetical protein
MDEKLISTLPCFLMHNTSDIEDVSLTLIFLVSELENL